MNITNLKTAACYIRVSTDKQEELSPDSQLKEIKKYAKDHGYILHSDYIFIEQEGISGKRAEKRPAFQKMIATAKTKPKPFDVILLWKFSRFARNQDESAFYKGILRKRCKIDVISISEPIIDGMYGRLIEMIIEWNDEFYSYNLSGEVMRGMKEKAERGGYQSAPPLGYTTNQSTGIPEPDTAADIVRKIFNQYAYENMSFFQIARNLNELGIRTKKGNPYESRTVKYILENPFYIGKIRWNRQHHEDHTVNDKSQWIISDAAHEAIVSEELFNHVQDLIFKRQRPRKTKPTSERNHWLSGMIKCSNCGASLALSATNKNGTRSFQCINYSKGKCHISHSTSESKMTKAILDALDAIKSSPNIQYERIRPIEDDDNDIAIINKALTAIDSKEKRIKLAFREGIDTIEEYKANKEILNSEREELLQRLSKIKAEEQSNIHSIEDYRIAINNVYDVLLSNADNTTKGEALRSIVRKIDYNKKEQRIIIDLISYN